jgi:hypothetical protein
MERMGSLVNADDDDEVWTTEVVPPSTGDIFEVPPPQLRPGSVPLIDSATGLVIGYRYDSGGFWIVWDVEGNVVEVGELPLESPLIDPIDLLAGGLVGLIRSGLRGILVGGARGAVVGAGRAGLHALSTRTLLALHRVIRTLIRPGSLKFAAKPALRMANPGRYVPIHTLHLAIRHGRQVADPRGARGAVMYLAEMWKNGKPYTLEVVVRVRDSKIFHFKYFPK